ncbi:MAG: 3-keto-5-aminohexanoate cleavage protein [Actinobacteria bacterium]|nr:3-keto-5-aminohexanoate cleavage protein [Actinomycetota bacterium]
MFLTKTSGTTAGVGAERGQTGAVDPVIIEVALNGATRPASQPHVPVSPEQIAASGVACVEAGATIVHQHDDLRAIRAAGGGPEAMGNLGLTAYAGLLSVHPEVLVYPTANFLGSTIGERWDHHRVLASRMPEAGLGRLRMGLVDPGSVTLGSYVYGFSPSDVAYKWDSCRELGLGASIACFTPAYVEAVLAEHARRGLPPGSLVKFYLSPDFGLPPTRDSLEQYISMLAGTGLAWAVAVLGGDVVGSGLATMAIERGGHVRVGLEDFADAAGRTPRNDELVAEVADLARRSGRGVATSADTARILRLP